MFTVPTLSPPELGQWPLAKAGLPYRAARVLCSHGASTIDDMRSLAADGALSSIRGLGKSTAADITDYLQTCQQISAGTLQFSSLPHLLQHFLTPQQLDILLRRYGLFRPDTASSRSFMRLQEIANEFGLTRERVRQITEAAIKQLQGRLQQHCLSPLYADICAALSERDGIIRCDATAPLDALPWMGGYRASSAILLLHDIHSAYFTYRDDTFSLFSPTELDRVRGWLLNLLHQAEQPISAAELFHTFTNTPDAASWHQQEKLTSPTGRSSQIEWSQHALCTYAAALPGVIATRGQQLALTDPALKCWVMDILRPLQSPAHYREITRLLNESLQDQCRMGPRRIMILLHSGHDFIQTQSGYYKAKEEA